VLAFGHLLWREKSLAPWLRWSSLLLVACILGQITLGAFVIWTSRSVTVTTGHVVLGALTLAVTFLVTFFIHRDAVEIPAQSPA
jgi:heme a synthase